MLASQHTVEEAIASGVVPPAGASAAPQRRADPARVLHGAGDPVHDRVPARPRGVGSQARSACEPGRGNRGHSAPGPTSPRSRFPRVSILTPGTGGRFVAPTAPGHVRRRHRNLARAARCDAAAAIVVTSRRSVRRRCARSTRPAATTRSRVRCPSSCGRVVEATSTYGDTVKYPNHEPIAVNKLCVSPLCGGWLDIAGDWSGGTGTLVAWIHKAVTGSRCRREGDEPRLPRPVRHSVRSRHRDPTRLPRRHERRRRGRHRAGHVPRESTGRDVPAAVRPGRGRRMPFTSVRIAAGAVGRGGYQADQVEQRDPVDQHQQGGDPHRRRNRREPHTRSGRCRPRGNRDPVLAVGGVRQRRPRRTSFRRPTAAAASSTTSSSSSPTTSRSRSAKRPYRISRSASRSTS